METLTKRNTFMQSEGYKTFRSFDTLRESQMIADFLNKNADILNIRAIERSSGLSVDNLKGIMSGFTKTLHPDSVNGLISTLSRVGFMLPPKQITMEIIQNMVTRFYGVSINSIKSEFSTRDISQARQVCMFFSVEMTKNKYEVIGDFFGGRDHSSVTYSVKTVNNLIETDSKFRAQIEYLRKRIKPA